MKESLKYNTFLVKVSIMKKTPSSEFIGSEITTKENILLSLQFSLDTRDLKMKATRFCWFSPDMKAIS